MAYSEMVCLRQLLEEEFLPYLLNSLEFEESQVRYIHLKVNSLAPTSFAPTKSSTVQVDRIYGREILARIPYVVHLLEEMNSSSSLESFDENWILGSDSGYVSTISTQQSCREITSYLLEVISILGEVAEEAIFLHDGLASLLLQVKDSNEHHPKMNGMKVVVGRVGDQVEDFLTGCSLSVKRIDIEALMQVKSIISDLREDIDLLGGIRLNRLVLGGKLESSSRSDIQKKSIDLKYEELDTGLLRSSDTKNSSTLNSGVHKHCAELSNIVMDFDGEITKIVDQLTRPPSPLSIVTIAGMGGIGKTTLAKEVYHNSRVVYHFHLMAWASDLSSTDRALSHLLHQVIQEQTTEEQSKSFLVEGQKGLDKGQSLWRSLRKRRYLIVVDDLWDFDAWKAIETYFPDDDVGSRILVTSRSTDFPSHIPRNPPHCMRPLNGKQSWEMLEKLVFGKGNCPSELLAIGKEIAAKCGGLRLAIVVTAATLLGFSRSYKSWRSFWDNMCALSHNSDQYLDILGSSYNYLPHYLKSCYLFMGSFPTNCEIHAQELFMLWMAEGFLDCKSSTSSEKVAEEYLEDLVCRCLVLVGKRTFEGKIKTCFIHELLRLFCLREAYKQDYLQVFSGGAQMQRHLILNSINTTDLVLLPSLPHLRSFILLTPGFDVSQDVLLHHLSGYKWLRVLIMYLFPWDTFPRKILDLVNLRYLAINICYLECDSIVQLSKLQTLIIYGPWKPQVDPQSEHSPTLFVDCRRMPRLRNLCIRVPSCLSLLEGDPVPSNIQSLSTVTFYSCGDKFFLSMTRLKKLGLHETRNDYENGECKLCFHNLHSLTELEILKCCFYKGNEKVTRSLRLDALPASLKRLSLCGSCLSWV